MQRPVAADVAPLGPLTAQVRAPGWPVDDDLQGVALHLLPRAESQLPSPVIIHPVQPERPPLVLPAHGDRAVRGLREAAGHVAFKICVSLAFADLGPRTQVRRVAMDQPL